MGRCVRGAQPGFGPPHSRDRGTHESQYGLPRSRPCLKSGGLDFGDKHPVPGTAQQVGCVLARANYLAVGQIYLYDNPLLKRPLTLADVKHMLLGRWGTTPGQNLICAHLRSRESNQVRAVVGF